ncbi:uncharacterized protein Triagg1_3881 [Trichoderma aggressivum f. europaeum]|uniref:Uncharacterized protein n=1 Tax=Trichoderma aggressivum f. europaeum TaxID=173218 RepID=A0AAE1M218_9HYPO|nr:hypothetical protein Triagg1_3881 [Trichoderma aggressivum f. europaeum]
MANIVQEDGIHVDGTTKFNIGNRYWHEGSSVKTLIQDIKDVTNCDMICSREWEVHYPQLDELYDGAQQTIYVVTEAIVAWCKAFISLAAEESNWKWKNEMIRKVDKVGGRIRLEIKVSRSPLQEQEREKGIDERGRRRIGKSQTVQLTRTIAKIYQAKSPSVLWSDEDLGFVLCIPEKDRMDMSKLVFPFKDQLLSAFGNYELYHIPKVQDVKDPSELLLKPPYYLSIQSISQTYIIVHSSHSPSLEFLAKYLRKNCRRSRKHMFAMTHIFKTLGPPVMDIELHQNPFTPKESAIYDTLTLKADSSPGGPVKCISPFTLVHLVREEPLEEPLEVVYR